MGCFNSKEGEGGTFSLKKDQIRALKRSQDKEVSDFSLEGLEIWAKVVNVYDGDTFRVSFYMNPTDSKQVKFKVRGNGYNACEMYPNKDHPQREREQEKAIYARNRFIQLATDCKVELKERYTRKDVQSIVDRNKKLVFVRFSKFEKFGRVLADVFEDRNAKKSINQILIDERHAVVYNGEGRDKNALTVPD
jgi:endonuclease YncB( thermonuclease family)